MIIRKLTVCPYCKVMTPPRASHCKRFNKCVLRFDHFCTFTGNTVGINNYKYFILFLIYGAVGTSMIQLVIVKLLYQNYSEKSIHWTIWFMFFQNGFFWLFSNVLFVIHSFFLLNNITLKEFFTFYRAYSSKLLSMYDYPKEYNEGIYKNLQSVLGTDPLVWLCPWKYTPREDGYIWGSQPTPSNSNV